MCSVVSDPLRPMDCSPPGFSVHGISQARILEWVPFPTQRDLLVSGIVPMSLASPVYKGTNHFVSARGCLRASVETASSQSFSPLSFRGIVSALKFYQSLFLRILT